MIVSKESNARDPPWCSSDVCGVLVTDCSPGVGAIVTAGAIVVYYTYFDRLSMHGRAPSGAFRAGRRARADAGTQRATRKAK